MTVKQSDQSSDRTSGSTSADHSIRDRAGVQATFAFTVLTIGFGSSMVSPCKRHRTGRCC